MQQLSSSRMRCAASHRARAPRQLQAGARQSIAPCRAVRAADSLGSLIAWAESNKVATDRVATSVNLATEAPMLVAARDIPAGEALLTVPDALWVSPAAAARSPIGPKVAGLEPWLQLALLLVHERAKASGSAVPRAFLDSLPQKLDTPLFWSGDEIDAVQGTQLLQQVYGYRQFFQQTFADLDASLFASDRALFPSEAFTYEVFLWAAATVRSRAHAPLDGADIALVPLADQLRHKRGGNCIWKAKSAGLFGRGQALAVEATRNIRKGEELVMDYGVGKLDSAVLLDYGVVDADWPQGGYTLSLSIPDSDRYRDDKLDVLERSGLSGAASFPIKKGDEPTEEMMGFLRLAQLSGSDCFLLEPIFEAEVWSFMCQPVSEPNEAAVCNSCIGAVRAALGEYATTIEEDMAALRGSGVQPGSRMEMAVQVRLGEKEALDGFLAWLEARQASLPRLEYYQERRLKRLGLMDDDGRTTYDSFFKDSIA